jgi:hypothetical protein
LEKFYAEKDGTFAEKDGTFAEKDGTFFIYFFISVYIINYTSIIISRFLCRKRWHLLLK